MTDERSATSVTPCEDIECQHDECHDARDAKARERATGHRYQGPGYCRTCGVREDLHV